MPLERPSLHYVRSAMKPKLLRARALAQEIEQLLVDLTADEVGVPHTQLGTSGLGYQVRLAQGLTRSLIDQLEEIDRGPASSRKLLVTEEGPPKRAEWSASSGSPASRSGRLP